VPRIAVTLELVMLTNHHHHSKARLSSFDISNVKLHVMAQHIIYNDLFMSTEHRTGLSVRSFLFCWDEEKVYKAAAAEEEEEEDEAKKQ